MSTQDTSALLLGSWEIYRGRLTRDGNVKRVDKKGGIKRTFTKKGEPVPDGEWAEGDLDYMERLMNRKDIEVFDRLSYLEHRTDGAYAGGKDDILEKIERFFEQNDKTRFVLYFTGHGTKDDGSWCIPVTTRRKKSRASTLVEEPRQGHSEPAPHGTPADDEAAGQGANEIEAEVHDKSDSEGDGGEERHEGQENKEDHAAATQTPPPANKLSQRHEPQSGSTQGSLSSIVSSYVIIDHAGNFPDPDSDRPDPTDRWNDFVTYEDVIKIWKKHKEGKGERFLMMILDCCHSGMWVDKVNGVSTDDVADGENRPQICKRNDVCIQASCHPVEESMVAHNQRSSFFTRAFVNAQERTAFEKVILTLFDHAFVFNAVSFGSSPIIQPFTPVCSDYGPFGGIEFFDSFDDMYLQT